MIEEANLMENTLMKLEEFLETHNLKALDDTTAQVEKFAQLVKASLAKYIKSRREFKK